ncbi:MAG: type I-E CRISPR-associated protein Cas7/Cse4/CasC, partial [Methermicoccaceae archaeon]
MTDFVQLHILASYPPSNLNRDDLGRPKTAVMGGTDRLRVSSQSLKRAWRTSEFFWDAFSEHMGIRTKEMGVAVYTALTTGRKLSEVISGEEQTQPSREQMSEEESLGWAEKIAGVFGKPQSSTKKNTSGEKDGENRSKEFKKLKIEQLAHITPEEIAQIDSVLERLAAGNDDIDLKSEHLLQKQHTAVDVAMFGRMLADSPAYNTEAAVQVSHAITVHSAAVEDDYFTGVDDLNKGEEDVGAAHIGELGFASGLFYIYVCINVDLLTKNLGGDAGLAKGAIRALVEAATKVSPTGKQNSFASRAYASYVLAEEG